MKRFITGIMIVSVAAIWLVGDAEARDITVRGHVTKRGIYVPPHHRTTPDKSKANNYGSKGNFNPYTGKPGTVDPYLPHSVRPRKTTVRRQANF
ncbi:MAG TPA: hypothetical protein VMV54_09050 [Acidocella sp.]|nr:hypothetical protein [Acidocella sp.]